MTYNPDQEPTKVESLDYSTALWMNQKYIKKVTLSENKKSIVIIDLISLKMGSNVVFKIPGMPIIYIDADIESTTEKPILYYSKSNYMPTILPSGSTVNGKEWNDGNMIFPQSGAVDIHPASITLNKTFYCSRNNQGGFTL